MGLFDFFGSMMMGKPFTVPSPSPGVQQGPPGSGIAANIQAEDMRANLVEGIQQTSTVGVPTQFGTAQIAGTVDQGGFEPSHPETADTGVSHPSSISSQPLPPMPAAKPDAKEPMGVGHPGPLGPPMPPDLPKVVTEEPRNPMFRPTSAIGIHVSDVRGYTPDLSHVNPDLMKKFMTTQKDVGKTLPIVSGYRNAAFNASVGGANHSQHMLGNAIDIDVSHLSQQEQVGLIQTARKNGIGGIGVYGKSMHFDVGPKRAWGPDYHADSVPMWARSAVNA